MDKGFFSHKTVALYFFIWSCLVLFLYARTVPTTDTGRAILSIVTGHLKGP